MHTAIIIEDEENAAALLENMLKYVEPKIEVLEKCGDLPSGVKSIKKYKPEIVFLDIELPVYSGIQLLDFFNPEEINFHIIFTTASNEYAVRAFEMSAVDYLMKPLQEDKLRHAVEKVIQKHEGAGIVMFPLLKENFQSGTNKKMVVPVANGFEIINLSDILYLKAEGSYTCIYLATEKNLVVSKNLKHFQFLFKDSPFLLRVHRSIIVNTNYIKRFIRREGGILVLEDKTELPVSPDKIDELIALLQRL